MNIFLKNIQSFFFVLFVLTSNICVSQYYITGQDPASIKWKQINSKHARIIFPAGYYIKANEYANLIEVSHKPVSYPYLNNNKKIKIVLHNRSVTSNAMVSPTPMHADFFETPDQNSYAQLWSRQLTLHEYRHVVQMQKLNQGFTKGLKILFGDQAIGGIMGLFLPFWFIEGDAVFSETIFSKSGRGREPSFSMDLVAQVCEKKIYSYDKALFGSFKSYTPDYYTLGYELVTFGVLNYGSEIWNNTLNKVARKPYTLAPFSSSLKKIAGAGKVNFYRNVLLERGDYWKQNIKDKSDPRMITPQKNKFYSNYRFAQELSDGSFIAEKSGLDDINRFIRIRRDGSEEVIFTPGFDFMESLSVNDSLICWNERTYDPRWSNRNYSVIKVYDFKNKKLKQITRRSRLFSPSMSNSADIIVAVDVSSLNEYSLSFIDIATGEEINSFSTKDNLFFMNPSWSQDDNFVVAIVLGEYGKSIIKIDVNSGDYEYLLPFNYTNISYPVMKDKKIVFTGAYTGVDNMYLLDIMNNNQYQLSNVKFGASDAKFQNSSDNLIFSNYTSDGFRIAFLDTLDFKKVNLNDISSKYLIDTLVTSETFILDEQDIPEIKYQARQYSKIGHLLNFHSWGLAAIDLNNYDFQPGVNILTQNTLSTAWGSVGYYYDPNEQAGKAKASFTYAGWYPKLTFSADYGLRRSNYYDVNNDIQEFKWNETNLAMSISLPLNFTHSKWVTGINPTVGIAQKFLGKIDNPDISFKENSITSLTYSFYGYTQIKRSKKDIYPRYGLNTNIIMRHTPLSDSISLVYGFAGIVYLPGVINHQGIRVYAAYQFMDNGNYTYGNVVSTPRGYTGINLKEMLSLKVDYAFPVIYPDLDLPSIAYLKRITIHGFYDHLIGKDILSNNYNYSSAGIELYSDWNFLSLIPNIRLGVRSTYRLKDNQIRFEFLYGFSI